MDSHGRLGSLHPVTDRLPALTDHHADPSCGPAAVCRAPLPYSRGKGAAILSSCFGRKGALVEPSPLPAILEPVPQPGLGEHSASCASITPLWLSPSLLSKDLFAQRLSLILCAHPPQLLTLPSLSLSLLQKDLLGIQLLLNNSETSLHQLTAMLDCRGLHKVLGDQLWRVWGTPAEYISQREASKDLGKGIPDMRLKPSRGKWKEVPHFLVSLMADEEHPIKGT